MGFHSAQEKTAVITMRAARAARDAQIDERLRRESIVNRYAPSTVWRLSVPLSDYQYLYSDYQYCYSDHLYRFPIIEFVAKPHLPDGAPRSASVCP